MPTSYASQEVVRAIEAETSRIAVRVRYGNMKACDALALGQVKRIACPPLAICGLDDVITPPKYAEYFKATMPHCTLEVISGAGIGCRRAGGEGGCGDYSILAYAPRGNVTSWRMMDDHRYARALGCL